MKLTHIAAVAAALLASSTAASAAEVTDTIEIKASPAKVWAASADDFCGIAKFHPAIEKCALSAGGKTRTLSLKGGGTIVENLTAHKDGSSYSYVIVESPLPVADYKSTFSVKGSGDTSMVTWTGSFEPKGADEAAAKKVIAGIYAGGLAALKAKF
ncbi:SRPBCC family protein [Methylopila sp. M107]|uniref:SRPBCC family protein n=1 Tax=Methylopila sp. M107 TaxID=1101190 RepID=UPI00036B34EF|nr:SRPBCC family protein [Methylopila sp. M107]